MKQIEETELLKHLRWLASKISLWKSVVSLSFKETVLSEIVANTYWQGSGLRTVKPKSLDETCCKETNVTLVKADGAKPMTVVSGRIKTAVIRQGIDMVVPSSLINQLRNLLQ